MTSFCREPAQDRIEIRHDIALSIEGPLGIMPDLWFVLQMGTASGDLPGPGPDARTNAHSATYGAS